MNYIKATGMRDDVCCDIPTTGSILTKQEWDAVGQAVSYRGTKRVAWRKGACKYGSLGYIFQQAKVMALNPHRMPSEFILLFNGKQRRQFWSLTNKMMEMAKNKVLAVEFNNELVKRMGAQS